MPERDGVPEPRRVLVLGAARAPARRLRDEVLRLLPGAEARLCHAEAAARRALASFAPQLLVCDWDWDWARGEGVGARAAAAGAARAHARVLVNVPGPGEAAAAVRAGAAAAVIRGEPAGLGGALEAGLERWRLQRRLLGAEAQARESSERYRRLAEDAPDAIFRYRAGPEPGFEYLNPAVMALTGLPRERIESRPEPLLALLHEEDRPVLRRALGELAPPGRLMLLRWVRADGKPLWMEQRLVPVPGEAGAPPVVEGIARDVTERMSIEEEALQAREVLRRLSARLQRAREEERTAIAREVHDELGQALTALKMDVAWIERPRAPREMAEKTRSMRGLIDRTISAVQRICTELRPGILDDFGLEAAVEWQAGEFARRSGLRCSLRIDHGAGRLDRERETALFRILQEALTNVARHAAAGAVAVSLAVEGGFSVLEVRDDGRGPDPAALESARSFGIIGMRERARAFGGDVEVRGPAGGGTVVKARMPGERGRGQR